MLKPAKCIFGIWSKKFYGLTVSKRGIETNPNEIKAIFDMETPYSIKDDSDIDKKGCCPSESYIRVCWQVFTIPQNT